MSTLLTLKRELRAKLLAPGPKTMADLAALVTPGQEMRAVTPLISFLPAGGLLGWRAVLALGLGVSALAGQQTHGDGAAKARTVMRRLMWHMNEDSGNMGWGVCEAMGEICAQSPLLAAEYGRIILSYVRDTGRADNYLEHGPLRRGAYWAVARLGAACAPLRETALPLLIQGLSDEDMPARGVAAWGLGRMATAFGPQWSGADEARPLLERLRHEQAPCEVLEDTTLREEQAGYFACEALARIDAP